MTTVWISVRLCVPDGPPAIIQEEKKLPSMVNGEIVELIMFSSLMAGFIDRGIYIGLSLLVW